MARSLTSETKARFDALLKAALTRKNTNSTLNLIANNAEKGEHNEAINLSYEAEEEENTNFILDKFLNEDNKDDEVKKPIPKVRKKLQHQKRTITDEKSPDQSEKSDRTFDISKNEGSIHSEYTNRTFDIQKSSTSDDSNRTYKVDKTEVGDILVHNRVSAISILKINEDYPDSSIAESIRTQPEEIEMVEFVSKTADVSEVEKSDRDIEKSIISYEDEISNRKKKKKKKDKKELAEDEGIREENNNFKYDKILSIVVHRTDRLKLNKFIVHPMVKIYIVNFETGLLVKKTDPGRAGVMYFENKDIDYLMPVLTQNFNLQENRKFYPEWEESIIINENFNYICEETTKVILFFELIDFLNFDETSSQSDASSRGWHQIAWAFLKLTSSDGTILNINKKLRLQLYKPGALKRGTICQVYEWWKGKRIKYPSTLYVTVKGLISPDVVIETFRSKTPLEREKSQFIFAGDEILKEEENMELLEEDKRKVGEVLAQLEEKTSKFPNKSHRELNCGDEGCFALKFSHSGGYLACSVLENKIYTVVLYLAPDCEQFYKLACHQELIYNIAFSKDDNLLLTSSADGTVSIWDLRKMSFMQMLPHPSFVYRCDISRDNFIVTGCFDKTVRVWDINEDRKDILEYELFEELEGHEGYVTSICISAKSDLFYTSDSIGVVICWKRNGEHWELLKKLVLPELRSTVINQIILLKKEKRLIVHSRDSIVRIVDMKNECVIYWLEGAVNNRVRTTCCISPCYSYIYVGSENGSIIVWNIENGKLVAVYHPYTKLSLKDLPIHSMDFSTKSNLLAFSHFGHKIPISVYTFDTLVSDVEVKIYDAERKWKEASDTALRKEKQKKRNRLENAEQVVDLKEILEKIDRIIN